MAVKLSLSALLALALGACSVAPVPVHLARPADPGARVPAVGYQGVTAVTCLDGALSLYDAQWTEPVAWIFGSEGQGVRPELIAAADLRILIPMAGGLESLNVGAAAAICLFEARRRQLA